MVLKKQLFNSRNLRKSKKAAVYPVFVTLFTIFALTFAFIKLYDAKKITDSQGNELFVGTKQTAVFAALQDSDAVNLFIDVASELSAQQALDKIKDSCLLSTDEEADVDELVSPCGKYVYPQWSTNSSLCFPDCETAFLNAFKDDFLNRTDGYFKLTGVELPISYDFQIETFEDHFFLRGLASSSTGFNVLSMEQRLKTPAARMIKYQGGMLAWPLESSSRDLSSCYGWRQIEKDGKLVDDQHPAIDIPAPEGTPVLAAANGKVIATNDCWGRVVIYHGSGLSTEYLHLDSILVKVNQEVSQGERIGTVGRRGKINGVCTKDYPPHLHFAVIYKYVNPNLNYKGQRLVINSFGTSDRIHPECLLEGVRSRSGTGCNRPVNTELDQVCKMYNLPKELLTPVEQGVTGSVIYQSPLITGKVPADLTGTSSLLKEAQPINLLGTYSFNPSFTTRVNKNFNDPLKPLVDWFEETWNACDDNPKECLTEKMNEFNKQPGNNYTLAFASNKKCEENPLFSDMIEFFEDCFASGNYKCSCKFDFSKAYSNKDLSILFDTSTNTATLLVKDDDGKYSKVRDYEFFYGKLEPIKDSHKKYSYVLDFDEKTRKLKEAMLVVYELSDGSSPSLGGFEVFNNYPIMKLEKTDANQAKFFDIESDDNKYACQIKKDKFRLCAYPTDPNRKDLVTVRFAFQMKDQPPKPVSEGSVKLVQQAKDTQSPVNSILDSVLVTVPVLREVVLLSSLLEMTPSTMESSTTVIADAPKDKDGKLIDIAGYEVYCNDYLTQVLKEDVLKNFAPSSFVVVANQDLNNLLGSTTRYAKDNPYSKFLAGTDCYVPVTNADGETTGVPGIKGVYDDGKVIFNINTCGSVPIFLDKFIRKTYCVTLIPVDKNGNKLKEEAVSNCIQTNSIMDMVVNQLLKTELGSIIPVDLIPEDMKPYISLPDSNKIADILSGKERFSFANVVNLEKLEADLGQGVVSSLLDKMNNEIISSALTNSVNDLNSWERQIVMSSLEKQLKNQDLITLFDKALNNYDFDELAKQKLIEESINFMDESKASDMLKRIARGEDPNSLAYNYLVELADKMEPAEKANDLLDAARSSEGQELYQKIIEAANNKGCIDSYDVSVEEAIKCLNNDELSKFYTDYLTDYNAQPSTQRALLEKAVDKMQTYAPETLKNIALNSEPSSLARELLDEAMKEMPEWAKSSIVSEVMNGRTPDAGILQSELLKMIPDVNNEAIANLMRDGNINALLKDKVTSFLEKQLDSFLRGGCTPNTNNPSNS